MTTSEIARQERSMTDSNIASVTAVPRNLISEAKTIAVLDSAKITYEDLNQLTHLLLVP